MRSKLSRGTSLRTKIIVSAILCLLIPAITVQSLLSYQTQNLLKEQAIKNSEMSGSIVYQYLSNLINNMIAVSNKIQFNKEINSILLEESQTTRSKDQENDDLQSWFNEKKMTKYLEDLVQADSLYITLFLPNGKYYTNYSYDQLDPAFYLKQEWFPRLNELSALETLWVGALPIRNDEISLTIARTIKGSYSHPYAYLMISLPEKQVNNIFTNYSNGQQFVIVDAQNVILTGSDYRFRGSQLEYNENEIFATSKNLSFGGWKVVSLVPYDNLTRYIKALYRNMSMIQFLLFSLFILIIIYAMSRFTNPLVKLARVAAKIDAGNISIRSRVTGHDEVGILGRSFDLMLDRFQEMIQHIKKEQDQKRLAELELLQAQLKPHFLFNTLNSIRMGCMLKEDGETANLLMSLSFFLRMTINRNNEFIRLQEELDTVKHYVKLINFRNFEKAELIFDVAEECLECEVPRFFLQPIVENAIVHGFEQCNGNIEIKCRMQDGYVAIAISDTGQGMTEEKVSELLHNITQERKIVSNTGIGMKNVYDRMRLTYGMEFHLDINSRVGIGTTIGLRIPRR
ncbi:sensor histidine kinase [Paenibacillus thalictri]|uniref:histidine kinase n=1 Tax=Paenibacillus thalictri TaxID=2527873 RepID=A0A4Q9DLM5_9BACL|nr:sensor histidine kinase [Paenibacillus thalictri]TBL74645.1 sensor histidine kinase [Paenibacillus thalictri]